MATQTHEFKGKTVDDAVEEGLRVLGLARGNVAIDVVQKGSRGIFGLGSEPAIVRLTPQALATSNAVTNTPVEASPVIAAESATNETPRQATMAIAEPAAEAAPAEVSAMAGVTETDPPAPPVTAPASEEEADQELVTMATHLLSEMVRLMGFQAEVRASWQDDGDESFGDHDHDHDEQEEGHARSGRYLLLDVEGSELGALIGRRGETLENIQYLLRLMVNQKLHKWKNIVIDVEHYKARRVAQLTQLAERMAEQVARTGRSISLEPMPANERRVVHMTLRDHPKVYTESYGDGGRRKVHIFART